MSSGPLSPRRPRAVTFVFALLTLALVLYVAHLTVGIGAPNSGLLAYGLSDAIILGGALLCFARAATLRTDRIAWVAIGASILCFVASNFYWKVTLVDLKESPYPSIADFGWLAYYLPAYVGVALLLRGRTERVRLSGWIDGLIGALAVASVGTAIVFEPLPADTSGSIAAVATNLAYPGGDLVLMAFTVAAIGFLGWRPGRAWGLLALGFLTFAVTDSVYLYQAASGSYAEGGLVDAGWPLAALVIGAAAWQPMRTTRSGAEAGSLIDQIMTVVFATLAVGVLTLEMSQPVNLSAHMFAVAATIAVVLRLVIAAHESLQGSRQLEGARHQASTDDLTGLLNRRGFYARAAERLEAAVLRQKPTAMMIVDLDHFKEFNDSLGHTAGDQMLEEIAARVARAVPSGSVVGRLGGDEFAVVLPTGNDMPASRAAARAIQHALVDPIQLEGISCHSSASIGIAMAPDDGVDRTTLMRCADIAMYSAKKQSTGIEFFDGGGEFSRDRVELAAELRNAVGNGQLTLHYQPKGDLKNGRVDGVEALVRWEHPRRGLLQPAEFLPIGERYGLVRQLTHTVLEMALEQEAAWRQDGIELTIAVNISGADLLDTGFPAEVAGLLERYETRPGALQLEITENTVMIDPGRALDVLARLSELGITFALDDFGTGSSSLAYIKRLPISELKIDGSFVMQMAKESDDAVIVRSTIELGRNLGLSVVAEGVETDSQWHQLIDYGCDVAQGFYLSKPLPPEQLIEWLIRDIRRIDLLSASAHHSERTVTRANGDPDGHGNGHGNGNGAPVRSSLGSAERP